MTSPLSGIAVEKRRQLAATLGLFAALFVAVGAVAATGATTAPTTVLAAAALVVALVLALMAWGVVRSVRLDLAARAGRDLDATLEAAVRASGGSMCGCGEAHDPDELHFVDGEGQHLTGSSPAAACAHDGRGAECSHSCETCVLAALRDPANERGAAPAPTGWAPRP